VSRRFVGGIRLSFSFFGFICDSPVPLGTLYYCFNFDGQQTRAGALGSQGTHSAFAGVPSDTSMIGLEMHIGMIGLDCILYDMIRYDIRKRGDELFHTSMTFLVY
jgi:hypothetical protein